MANVYINVEGKQRDHGFVQIGTFDENGCHMDGLWVGETPGIAEKSHEIFDKIIKATPETYSGPQDFIARHQNKFNLKIQTIEVKIPLYIAKGDETKENLVSVEVKHNCVPGGGMEDTGKSGEVCTYLVNGSLFPESCSRCCRLPL